VKECVLLIALISWMIALPAAAGDEAAAASAKAAGPVVFQTDEQRMSYSIGIQVGMGLKGNAVVLDPDLIMRGMKDAMAGADWAMPRDEVKDWMGRFQQVVMEHRREKAREEAGKGKIFLDENAKKDGIVALPSGLQYKIITPGTGQVPGPADKVKAHYRGTLTNGDMFDSSYNRGEPSEFEMRGVIPGWQEALQLMKEGAKWQLFIPPDLAYGERGSGNAIGPNAVLLFDIELIEIVD